VGGLDGADRRAADRGVGVDHREWDWLGAIFLALLWLLYFGLLRWHLRSNTRVDLPEIAGSGDIPQHWPRRRFWAYE
jgi:hypothetical protein